VGLSLHVVSGQLCRNRSDFQDSGFVRQDIDPESEWWRFRGATRGRRLG
jgi:hypothetical protein